MLKGISHVLSPELLKILMEMGHADEIVLGDANFPAPVMPSGWSGRRTRNSCVIKRDIAVISVGYVR